MNRLFILLFLLLSTSVSAQVRLARLFSDHVVLQRQKPIPVWGWAKPAEKVTVKLAGLSLSTKADDDGKWMIQFTPMEAGGPHEMTVTAKSGRAEVHDILIGEVWLCSGQSNIEWPVSKADNFATEKKNSDFPQIRHFLVEHQVSLTPEKDLKSGEWKIASPETVGSFTAIGFFFARELYQKLNVPVGILHASWGGSQIEGWISKEAMLTSEELRGYGQNLPKTWEEADKLIDNKLKKQLFKDASYQPTLDDEKKYTSGTADFTNWLNAKDPVGQWDWKGLMGFRGQAYMAKLVSIPAEMISKPTTLSLPENDSKNEIYINGKLISSAILKGSRKIMIPADTWKEGDNQLVIRMGNLVGTPWFGPGLMGKAEELYVEDGLQKISLSADWKLMPAFAEKHEYARFMNNVGTSIFNAMIVPIVPFSVRGILWYQGETNASRAFQYRKSFPLLINDWRKLWNDQFSFYWVQLSSFGPYNDSNKGSEWAELREAQNMTLTLPKTGTAITTDIGNPKDIHPTNKQDVAHRLAATALKLDYGQDIVYSSPLYDNIQFEGDKAIISFKHTGGGLVAKDRFGYLKGFEIAGDDKVFYYAKAEIVDNRVVVWHSKVSRPVAVRYAWADSPEDANLFNKEGFPASGFRTDSWDAITENSKFE